jgi:hypothetical protein
MLEDRRLLSTFNVTSTADTLDSNNNPTSGTLRWAVQQADAATDTSTINFDPTVFATPQTITLLHGQLELSNTNDSISFNSPTCGLTVSGGGASRVFQVDNGVTASISGLTISGGSTSTNGGGLSNSGTLTLTGCTISGNSGFAGGGLYNAGTLAIGASTISNNTGQGSGGGLFNLGTVDSTGCTISGNSTSGATGGTGGGFYGYGNSGSGNGGGLFNVGTARLINCTLSGNTASGASGVFNYGPASMRACTASGNTSPGDAAAIVDYSYSRSVGVLTLTDTIVAGNLGSTPGDWDFTLFDVGSTGAAITGSYNLIGTGGAGIIPGGVDGNIVLTNHAVPVLSTLGNYGGSTMTMALLPGSPAIGAGTTLSGIAFDQRGEPLDSPNPDIGAFQSQGFTLTPVAGSTPQSTVPGTAFANPLAVSVTADNSVEPVDGGSLAFAAPVTGASAQLSATTATVGTGGVASVTATANATGGSYTVNASVPGAASSVTFALSNLIPISFSGLSDQSITYGTSSVSFAGTLANGSQVPQGESVAVTLNGVQHSAAIDSSGAFTTTFNTSSISESGSPYTITYAYTSDGTFASASTTSALTVNKATPTINWPNPADITYGTALGSTQLDATASVAGTFSYTPFAGTVLHAGAGQALSVSFTPADTTDYTTATATAMINVNKATPKITWPYPGNITYGTPLSATQLDATASVPGSFVYTPSAGTVLHAGAGQTLSVSFTPTDAADYTTATATAKINVERATPSITWANPADIIYGARLSITQLNASASLLGAFAYTPAVGAVLNAGAGQTLSVSFTPTDAADYTAATATAKINVNKATPAMNWPSPADIIYGTALSSTQLDATASWNVGGGLQGVTGTFAYNPATGTVLSAGKNQTLSVSFTPSDTTDYNGSSATATINVNKATPTMTWANPAGITYGTALSSTQLNSSASVPGTFTYTPGAGIVLNAGTGQTLSVSFTPADTTDYTTAAASATINVAQATPTIFWANPADIIYGTALSSTQLNALASVPGTFIYSPALGTVLNAGNGQTLSVTFSPTDAADYAATTAIAKINVGKATPTISWGNPADITYGAVLSSTQLNASTATAGKFVYTPAAGTVLDVGQGQVLSASFVPSDTNDFTGATATAAINVKMATPAITWAKPPSITYGTVLDASLLSATASVPGNFTYLPAPGTVLKSGAGETLSVSFTPTDTSRYQSTTAAVTINVDQAKPTLIVAAPGGTYDGAPHGASASISGIDHSPAVSLEHVTPTLAYFVGPNVSGTSLGFTPPIDAGTYTVVASFAGSGDYAPVRSSPATFTIGRGSAAVSLSSSVGSSVYGQSITFAAAVKSAGTPNGTVTFSDGPTPLATVMLVATGKATWTTTNLAIGAHVITAVYSGDGDVLGAQSGASSEAVSQDTTNLVLVHHAVYKKKTLKSVQMNAEVEPVAPGGGVPTGVVTFQFLVKRRKKVLVKTLSSAVVSGGSATLTFKPQALIQKTLRIVYSGDKNFGAAAITLPKLTRKSLM